MQHDFIFLQSPISVEDEDEEDCGTQAVKCSLRIMIINPSKKRDYTMVKADKSVAETIDEMKKLILSSFPSDVPQPLVDKLEFGYVEPGHGLKGKKEWIVDDDDMQEFWEKYRGKKEVTLWCYSQRPSHCKEAKRRSKRSRSKSPVAKSSKPGSSRYDAHIAKMAKVDEIFQKLNDTHGNKYSAEQKRAWAHLIELGKHESVIQPPKKRFFQPSTPEISSAPSDSPSCSTSSTSKSSACTNTQSAAALSAAITTSSTTLVASPGRRVSIRSECIDQLQKWHSLLDCGAITKEQYDELQGTILSDIKNL